jgi:hypothetical protein
LSAGLADAGRLARFEREARTLAALNHPHIGASGPTVGIFADLLNVTNQGVPLALTMVEESGATFGEPSFWADPRAVRIAARLKW